MDVAVPIRSVIPGLSGLILQVLARTEQPLTGTKIAELVGDQHASRAGVNKAVKSLVVGGLVTSQRVGSANLYLLNRQHIAAPSVIALSDLRSLFMQRTSDLVGTWSAPPVALWLFGSAARSDGDALSDIDLLAIRGDEIDVDDAAWNEQMIELASRVESWTGNGCSILEYSRAEFESLVVHDDPLVASLRHDAIAIAGAPVRDLVAGLQ